MNKITVPLFDDYLKTFHSKPTDGVITMACIARNGFEHGCCANFLIKTKTGLSDQTIQRAFTRLIDQGVFIECQKTGKERYGKIVINDAFIQKYLSLLVSNTTLHNNFTGTIQKINKDQSKIFLEGDDKRQYIAFCLNNRSTAFYLPIGIKIIFSGSLINCANDITTIWIDDKTLECYEPKPTNITEQTND